MIPAQPAHSMGVPAIPIATDNGSNWLDDYLGPQSISSTRSKRWREYIFFLHASRSVQAFAWSRLRNSGKPDLG
jgi:hypothetical protein